MLSQNLNGRNIGSVISLLLLNLIELFDINNNIIVGDIAFF